MMTDNEIAEIGCIICRLFYNEFSPTEIHHLREDTGLALKSSHKIGLCAIHHRLGNRGVAFHAGRVAFENNYGTQSELYEKTLQIFTLMKMESHARRGVS